MDERKRAQSIGRHAVVELHRQRVLEKIPPQRVSEEQVRGSRNEVAVDQWPGVEDQPGPQSGHQSAEIDLHDRKRQNRASAPTQTPRAMRRPLPPPYPPRLRGG